MSHVREVFGSATIYDILHPTAQWPVGTNLGNHLRVVLALSSTSQCVCLAGQRGTVKKQARLRALNRQIGRVERRVMQWQRTSYRLSWLRLAIASAGLLSAGVSFIFYSRWLGVGFLVVSGLAFCIVWYSHRRIEGGIRRHQAWLYVQRAHRARAQLDWENIPGAAYHRPHPDHPFEADLDIVGQRSIHRVLDTAVSSEGSQRLRDWLTNPTPDPGRTVQRQRLVRELKPMSLFRSKLAVNAMMAAGTSRTWETNQLLRWLERHGTRPSQRLWLLLLGVLAALDSSLLIADWMGLLRPWWQVSLALYVAIFLLTSRDLRSVWDEALALQDVLRQLRGVFRQLEIYPYQDKPYLKSFCHPFLDRAHRPSAYLARLTRIVVAMSVRGNGLVWLAVNTIVPWDLFFASRLEQAKATMAQHAPAWMNVWAELEALNSLANFAYLNPSYTFPDIVLDQDLAVPVFQADGLGHPLISDQERVCNDVAIRELGRITLITGSNMAGKSVFLKTVGVNVALANAAAPVCARHLAMIPFRLFTSMRVADSVTDGISYFYAEVKRLKALLTELVREDAPPLIFCIDEIFRGTNNRERLIGSQAYVRALAGKRGIGFIATHDLELAGLADQQPQVDNRHFRDSIVEGRMAFDYILRPGPSPTTNALTIMQLEGLPVGTQQDRKET